ncbi:LysR substrate-binding domain-containing protein [Clostridium sp. DSM 8431]|uniref:LysR substrate-binding domain-containing protein n=1 Tax=Clostridium sp. DSM 8431 TaxID=1761781 RepID=UPI000B7E650B
MTFIHNTAISKDELKEEKIIMRENGSGTRDTIERYLRDKEIDFDVYMELGSTEAIKNVLRLILLLVVLL